MTVRDFPGLSSVSCSRFAILLAFAAAGIVQTADDVNAQTNAASGNTGGTTQATGAAAQAGSLIGNQQVFSSAGEGTGALGNNDGRFAGSQLANQPIAGGVTNSAQNAAQNAADQLRNLQRANQQFNRTSQQNRPGTTQGTRTIRPSLRLGFTHKPRPTVDLQTSIGKHVLAMTSRLPGIVGNNADFGSVNVVFGKPGEVVLTGEVPTAAAGQLMTNILRMEPGVASVRNELTITLAAAPTE